MCPGFYGLIGYTNTVIGEMKMRDLTLHDVHIKDRAGRFWRRFQPALALTLAISFLALCCDQALCFLLKYFLGQMSVSLFTQQLIPCVLVSILSQPLLYWLVKCIAKIGASYEST